MALAVKPDSPDQETPELTHPGTRVAPTQRSAATPAAFPNVWISEQLFGYQIALGNTDRRCLAVLG